MRSSTKLLVFDLDGTLLDENHTIPEPLCALLRALRDRGIETTLATGRPLVAVRGFVRQLELQLPLIVFNGAVIASPDEEVEWMEPLPRLQAGEALRQLAACSGSTQIYLRADDRTFYTDVLGEAAADIRAKDGMEPVRVDSLDALLEEHGGGVVKLFSIGPREELEGVKTAYESVFPDYTCVFSEHDMLEFLGAGVTKGRALEILCERLDLPLDAVAAFGDNMNDLEMIQAAGLGVSMARSPAALSEAADATTEDLAGFLRGTFGHVERTGAPQ